MKTLVFFAAFWIVGWTLQAQESKSCLRKYRLAINCAPSYCDLIAPESVHPDAVERRGFIQQQVLKLTEDLNKIYSPQTGIYFESVEDPALITFSNNLIPYYPVNPFVYKGIVERTLGGEREYIMPTILCGVNQLYLDEKVGNANYDIGLILVSPASWVEPNIGGIAIGKACDKYKGAIAVVRRDADSENYTQGVLTNVLHEIGHAFTAEHTFSLCDDSPDDAFEPGTGSTIMAYPGAKCSLINAPKIPNSDALYFHGKSIERIKTFIATGAGSTCGLALDPLPIQELNAPEIINYVESTHKPLSLAIGTPFVLSTKSDYSLNALFLWEEMDLALLSQEPLPISVPNPFCNPYLPTGSLFRSRSPSLDKFRIFPRLLDYSQYKDYEYPDLKATLWEVLPLAPRELNFRLTVIEPTKGCVTHKDIKIDVSPYGPLKITTPNKDNHCLVTGQKYSIEWELNGTDQIVPFVNIILIPTPSTWGIDLSGDNKSIPLVLNTPNDGQEEITLPEGVEATYWLLKIEGAGVGDINFFDVAGCTVTDLKIQTKKQDPGCNDACDGSVEIKVKTPGKFKFETQFKNCQGSVLDNPEEGTLFKFGNLEKGIFSYKITGLEGWTKNCVFLDNILLEEYDLRLKIIPERNPVTYCRGSEPDEIELNAYATGGTPPYTYGWEECGPGCKKVYRSGNYGTNIVDANGCWRIDVVGITYIPVTCVVSRDPNEIVGPAGWDSLRWVSRQEALSYRVNFENDPELATAPAQRVRIEVPVDPDFNLGSFQLSGLGFANKVFSLPSGRSYYQTRLDARDSLGVFVDLTAGIDVVSRKAFWLLQAIDPATGLPPADPFTGLLPINNRATHRGEGYISFKINPKSNAVTKDDLEATATIIFDNNDPLNTNTWYNAVDAAAPHSHLLPLPQAGIENPEVALRWTGQDEAHGSGIDHYSLYFERDGQISLAYREGIPDTGVLFRGEPGHQYRFWVLATDKAGNRETKNQPEIFLSIGDKPALDIYSINQGAVCAGDSLSIRWSSSRVDSVRIEWSLDSGGAFNSLAGYFPAASHLFTWLIPDTFSMPHAIAVRIIALDRGYEGLIDTIYTMAYPRPTANAGSDIAKCTGESAALSASGGERYRWSPTEGLSDYTSSGPTADVLESRLYAVEVESRYGCKDADSVLIRALRSDTTWMQEPSCSSIQRDTTVRYLKNRHGCDSIVYSVKVPGELLAAAESKPLTCYGDSSGMITVFIHSGTPPYMFSLGSISQSTNIFSGLKSGEYIVSVADSTHCSASLKVRVGEPPPLTCLPVTDSLSCYKGKNGVLDLHVSGGFSPYRYILDQSKKNSPLFKNLAAGVYNFIIEDKNGCRLETTGEVFEPYPLTILSYGINDSCAGNPKGMIGVQASGGTPGYSYTWNDANHSTDPTVCNLPPRIYSINVTDRHGCAMNNSVRLYSRFPTATRLSVTPNPFSKKITIQFAILAPETVNLHIEDQSGKIVFRAISQRVLPRGSYALTTNALQESGNYTVVLKAGNAKFSQAVEKR